MRGRRWLYAAGVAAAFLAVTLVFTVVLFPPDEVGRLLERGLQRQGYVLQAQAYRRAFPLGLRAVKAELSDPRGPLLNVDEATVRLALLPLLRGRVTAAFTASLAGGEVAGTSVAGGATVFRVSGVKLEEVPFFRTVTGSDVRGELRGEGTVTGRVPALSGEVRAEIAKAEVTGAKIGELPLPAAQYQSVRGMLRLQPGSARLESLTFQGDGLYARLSGNVALAASAAASSLDLSLELMPQPDFLERQKLVFLLLAKYLASPGHYVIPVRGTLGHPAVS